VKVGNFVFEGVAGGVQVSFSLLKKKKGGRGGARGEIFRAFGTYNF